MTAARWLDQYPNRVPDRPDDHTALLAADAEIDASRAPILHCTCYVDGEYTELYPCDWCKAEDLTEIDLDGYDDKRELGETA